MHAFRSTGCVLLTCMAVTACSASSASVGPSDAGSGGGSLDAPPDAPVDKAAPCASTFGQAIGSVGFARFDGTVVAILPPGNKTCAEPNSTHLVLELIFSGAVYRMVVDVDDNAASGTIHTNTITHDLVGGPWQDGWHAVPLDYVNDLGLKAADFASTSTAQAVAAVTEAIDLGAHVSVFATAQGEADSAHLVHRNYTNQDGAIVIGVDQTSPTWLLFAFSDQSF